MHSLNVCEVYYHFIRVVGEPAANATIRSMVFLGIELFDELDPKLWKVAGRLKAHYKRLSLPIRSESLLPSVSKAHL